MLVMSWVMTRMVGTALFAESEVETPGAHARGIWVVKGWLRRLTPVDPEGKGIRERRGGQEKAVQTACLKYL